MTKRILKMDQSLTTIHTNGSSLLSILYPVWCKYSNALLRRWILGEVEMIGAKTHPEFVDLAVWQVAG